MSDMDIRMRNGARDLPVFRVEMPELVKEDLGEMSLRTKITMDTMALIVSTKDAMVRNGLIGLGWTPPRSDTIAAAERAALAAGLAWTRATDAYCADLDRMRGQDADDALRIASATEIRTRGDALKAFRALESAARLVK